MPLPATSRAGREHLSKALLRRVSRSFYLTVRVLPGDIREPVGLAYLLARAADTIADTTLLPPQERLDRLLAFRGQVEGPAAEETLREIGHGLTGGHAIPAEAELLNSLPAAFSMLLALPEADRVPVRSVVVTLTRGMEMDLSTFPPEDSGRITALGNDADLDRYLYYVAGCVGEFWTAITMAHTAALKSWDGPQMAETGVGFGKALQLTNVLRDVPRDLRIGRCYLPADKLSRAGLTPRDLLDPSAGAKARPILTAGIGTALGHYRAAEEYLCAIPRRCIRLRLAALWPLLIGLATLAKLATNDGWLDPARPSKVGRAWVYRVLGLSLLCAYSNSALRWWIGRLRRRVENAL